MLIVLRYRQPNHPRPFRVPGAVGRMPVMPLWRSPRSCLLLAHFDWRIYVGRRLSRSVLTAMAFLVRQWRGDRGG